jgi:hypothetical protein
LFHKFYSNVSYIFRKVSIFNYLNEPTSATAIAEAIGSHPENTECFLDSLASIDLIEKKDNLYNNTYTTRTFLVEGKPTYLGEFLKNQLQWHLPVLDNLTNLVLKGPP